MLGSELVCESLTFRLVLVVGENAFVVQAGPTCKHHKLLQASKPDQQRCNTRMLDDHR